MPMPGNSLSSMFGSGRQSPFGPWQSGYNGRGEALGKPQPMMGGPLQIPSMPQPDPGFGGFDPMGGGPMGSPWGEGMGAGGSAPIDDNGWGQWNAMPASTRAFMPEPRRGGVFGMFA